ncbi:MAG TPA: hypothetical protein VLH56_19075 [Dissulfurispiraceae bacterium]|nr:hypothetical protein [Dissulfurispiraceae bacterium]
MPRLDPQSILCQILTDYTTWKDPGTKPETPLECIPQAQEVGVLTDEYPKVLWQMSYAYYRVGKKRLAECAGYLMWQELERLFHLSRKADYGIAAGWKVIQIVPQKCPVMVVKGNKGEVN